MKKLLLKYGCKQDGNVYSIQTKVGTLYITDLNDLTFIPLIFGSDFDLKKFLEISHDKTVNPHTFKWNLHSSDKRFNLE